MAQDPHRPARQTWPFWAAGGVAVVIGAVLFSGVVPQLEAPNASGVAPPEASAERDTPVTDGPKTDPETAKATPSDEPRFDLVRVEDDGSAIVAGQAKPNAKVSVVLDGQTLADTTAGADGSFVVFVALSADDEPRVMWLMAETGEGDMLASVETVVIAPGQQLPGADQPAEAVKDQMAAARTAPDAATTERPDGVAEIASVRLPETALSETGSPQAPGRAASEAVERANPGSASPEARVATLAPDVAVTAVPDKPETVETTPDPTVIPKPTAESVPATPAAPRVLLSGRDGIQALDVPRLPNQSDLRIDTIDYGNDNTVVLRGRAGTDAPLRVALDGQVQARGTTSPEGVWTLVIEDVPEGLYELKVESLDAAGAVLGRAEVPFRREAPEVVEGALSERGARIVTVQPGATLWAIARDRYGAGTRYVQVFEANRDQIRNPDLIYPGQVFDLPQ